VKRKSYTIKIVIKDIKMDSFLIVAMNKIYQPGEKASLTGLYQLFDSKGTSLGFLPYHSGQIINPFAATNFSSAKFIR
jgi:hypothetical protein